jgi:single-strand DNA-binding protein
MNSFGLARLGRDAEVRYTSNGDAVTSLSLAFSYGRKGDDGNRPTQWVDASLWGKRAESLSKHLLKGTLVEVLLKDIHIETYQSKSGEGHKLVGEVIDIEFAGGGQRQEKQESGDYAAASGRSRNAAPRIDDDGSDIPF